MPSEWLPWLAAFTQQHLQIPEKKSVARRRHRFSAQSATTDESAGLPPYVRSAQATLVSPNER